MRLARGDLRTVGDADKVAEELCGSPERADELLALLFDAARGVRMRAADALEKASARKPALLRKCGRTLLVRAMDAEDAELRWHLAQMLPRTTLAKRQRHNAVAILKQWLDDRSAIVRVEALEALASLARGDAELADWVAARLRHTLAAGSPAEAARARKLMATLTLKGPAARKVRGASPRGKRPA